MSKKTTGSLARIIYLIIAALSFIFIDTLTTNPSSGRAALFLAWGTFFLIIFVVHFIKNREWPLGAQILFITACLLLAIFAVWLINQGAKLFVDGLAHLLLRDWHIGNIFPGVYNFLASVPSLICGAILLISAFVWDNPVNYRRWISPFLNGKSAVD